MGSKPTGAKGTNKPATPKPKKKPSATRRKDTAGQALSVIVVKKPAARREGKLEVSETRPPPKRGSKTN